MFKNKIHFIVGLIAGLLISCSIVYAINVASSSISYSRNGSSVSTVEGALNELYDKANNNIDTMVLYNGCEIKKDEENDYYLSFDGIDDFVQLNKLPASINWSDGVVIEFTAKWDALNYESRIFDFGNGENSNNFLIGTYQTTSKIQFASVIGNSIVINYPSSEITLTNKANYKIIYEKNIDSTMNIYLYQNNVLVTQLDNITGGIENIERTKNYLGKSHWILDSCGSSCTDKYFKGRIYKLKIDQANGVNIINIDLNKIA